MSQVQAQQAAGAVVHRLAKPLTRTLAWSSVLAGAAALAVATWRNVQER